MRSAKSPEMLDRLVWDPAGQDRQLASACQQVRAGQFAAARDLLADTGADWDRRCRRMLLLAQLAATSGAAHHWVTEEPKNPDAHVLLARTLVIQAAPAMAAQKAEVERLVERTREACREAAGRYPADPVPWVASLQLDTLSPLRQRSYCGITSLEDVAGPWILMGQLSHRDRWNREGLHRLAAAVGPRGGGSVAAMFRTVRWIADTAPAGSSLHVVPLLAHLAAVKEKAGSHRWAARLAADRQLGSPLAQADAVRAYEGGFAHPRRTGEPELADLHLLAHALWASGIPELRVLAPTVFEAIGPYALTTPWSLHGPAEDVFTRARQVCSASSSF